MEHLFVGTYTQPIRFGTGEVMEGKGEGVYLLEFADDGDGSMRVAGVFDRIDNPSFLTLSPAGTHLYCVNELKTWNGRSGGGVSAFALGREDWSLTPLGAVSSGGGDPCHIATDPAGSHVFVSNFQDGRVSVYPIREDGSLGEACDRHQHRGSGPDPHRQKGPHAHSLTFSPDGRVAYVPDLGIDRVEAYHFRRDSGRLLPAPELGLTAEGGSGPRYCEFSRQSGRCYLVNELASSVSVFVPRGEGEAMEAVQTASTLPDGGAEGNLCADLHLSPDGRFLYASNRGHDSLVRFRVDGATGRLEDPVWTGCGGRTPRNFLLTRSGRHLLAANQDSDNIVAFRVSDQDGGLERVGEICVNTPVCLVQA